jgi:methylated-DNA-protein-cysteine methyltransferase related protein
MAHAGRKRGRVGATKGRGAAPVVELHGERDDGGVVLRFEPFYRVVRRIPRGRVATYGQVAALAGRPRGARLCGYALSALRNTVHDVPWQRVLGARGAGRAGISLRDPVGAAAQRALLEQEGVVVDARGRVELGRFGWKRVAAASRPRSARRSAPASASP